MKRGTKKQFKSIGEAAFIMILGLIIFKYIPMELFGQDIQFDASAHVTITSFFLYIVWFYIDQNKSWRIPYFVFSLALITIISIQRIIVGAHNEIGITGGLIISGVAIGYAQRKYFKNKLKF